MAEELGIWDRHDLDDICKCGHEMQEHEGSGGHYSHPRGFCRATPCHDHCFMFNKIEPESYTEEKCGNCDHKCKDHRQWAYMWHDYCCIEGCGCQQFRAWVYSYYAFRKDHDKLYAKIHLSELQREHDRKEMLERMHKDDEICFPEKYDKCGLDVVIE